MRSMRVMGAGLVTGMALGLMMVGAMTGVALAVAADEAPAAAHEYMARHADLPARIAQANDPRKAGYWAWRMHACVSSGEGASDATDARERGCVRALSRTEGAAAALKQLGFAA